MKIHLFIALFLAAFLSGCTSTGRSARVDPAVVAMRSFPQHQTPVDPVARAVQSAPPKKSCELVAPLLDDRPLAIDVDCFRFEISDGQTAYNSAKNDKIARNKFSFVLLGQADLICELEKGALYRNRATTSAGLDFASSGFAITSTIVGGELAKSILSGLSGLSTASRTNVDANFYQNQLTSAITKVMDAERKSILSTLTSKQNNEIADYSVDEMIFLVNQYHQACSIQKGVQLLLDAAVNKEGVDRIVKAMNLRQSISEAQRNDQALARFGLDASSASRQALAQAVADAALQLAKMGETSQSVTIAPPQ